MHDCLIQVRPHCRACQAPLTLEEMHYLDHGDGTATCEACETKWSRDMQAWRASDDDLPPPERP